MEIKVLGTGCTKCKALFATVELAVSELNLDAALTKVEDIQKIIGYNVMLTPALVVDEKVVSAGKSLSKEEVVNMLKNQSTMTEEKNTELKRMVRQRYSELAENSDLLKSGGCCGTKPAAASKKVFTIMSEDYSKLKGYEADADLGVGCGLPTQYAGIKQGNIVIDLGSGAGNDCFIAREETGETGRVIGIDFSPQMIERARNNAARRGFTNIEFLEGDIEEMPVADNTADVVVSNCVLNLLPEKDKIFKEIFRVLKPGGHFCISDVVLNGVFPKEFTNNAAMYAGCIASAMQRKDYLKEIESAHFSNIRVERTKTVVIPDDVLHEHLDEATIQTYKAGNVGIYSITVTGEKPIL